MRSVGRLTVAAAVSGGVDSAVAAALSVEAGHRVIGMMLRLWSEPGAGDANACCSADAVDDAWAVCDILGIPFELVDARDVFKATVVDPWLDASAALRTPNPCLACNRAVRFGFLLERALGLGADVLATGHYARIDDGGGRSGAARRLLRAVDRSRDQSYVLHRLDQERLQRAAFPVGHLHKADVRRIAADRGLPVADRSESVDLCWLGGSSAADFLRRHLPAEALRPGPIVDADGRELGRHRGLPLYTLGQRRGLGVATGEPTYVTGHDAGRGALLVGPVAALDVDRLTAEDWHWIAGPPAGAPPWQATAQIRYRAPETAAWLGPVGDRRVSVTFATPQRAPTPGQAVVAYDGEVCLGGGTIAEPDGRAA